MHELTEKISSRVYPQDVNGMDSIITSWLQEKAVKLTHQGSFAKEILALTDSPKETRAERLGYGSFTDPLKEAECPCYKSGMDVNGCTCGCHQLKPKETVVGEKCVDTCKHIRYPIGWKYCPTCGEKIKDGSEDKNN